MIHPRRFEGCLLRLFVIIVVITSFCFLAHDRNEWRGKYTELRESKVTKVEYDNLVNKHTELGRKFTNICNDNMQLRTEITDCNSVLGRLNDELDHDCDYAIEYYKKYGITGGH